MPIFLDRHEFKNLTAVEEWLADNEVLDPEDPTKAFATFS